MEEEPVVKKEPVKVGKLNAGMFGGGAPEEEKPGSLPERGLGNRGGRPRLWKITRPSAEDVES